LNVLHLLGTGKPGGVETFVLQLAREIDRGDADFSVCIIGPDGEMSNLLRDAGAEVIALGHGALRQAAQLAAHIRERKNRFDVIHGHSGGRLLRMIAANAGHASLINHIHGIPEDWVPHLKDIQWIRQETHILGTAADEVAVSSRWMENLMVSGNPGKPVVMLPYGVDIRNFSPERRSALRSKARESFGIPEGALVVGFAARIVRQKGPRRLMELARRMASDTDVWFAIAGDGPLAEEVRESARRNGLERVRFAGSTTDMPSSMAAFDVTLMPSRWEPFGIVALESLAMGIPVVAFEVGGLAEAVSHEEDGLLAGPGDLDALEAALRKLLGDPDLRARMGTAGRARIERTFDSRNTARSVLEHYRALANRKSSTV
jgi:glycosyltransferase involved in cell wall biosynthesis